MQRGCNEMAAAIAGKGTVEREEEMGSGKARKAWGRFPREWGCIPRFEAGDRPG